MSLDNLEVVDAVGTEIENSAVVLTIVDSWDWQDQRSHLTALQAKLNTYFGFVESGQIYESYPDAKGKALRIDIVSKFAPPDIALKFLEKASAVAAQLNLTVTQRVH
jgi:hypothetical protein